MLAATCHQPIKTLNLSNHMVVMEWLQNPRMLGTEMKIINNKIVTFILLKNWVYFSVPNKTDYIIIVQCIFWGVWKYLFTVQKNNGKADCIYCEESANSGFQVLANQQELHQHSVCNICEYFDIIPLKRDIAQYLAPNAGPSKFSKNKIIVVKLTTVAQE